MVTARQKGLELSQTVEFNYRRRYNLPATDPRFLDATFGEMLLDMMAHRHIDDPKFREELVTDDFEAEVAAFMASVPSPEEKPEEWETLVDENYG